MKQAQQNQGEPALEVVKDNLSDLNFKYTEIPEEQVITDLATIPKRSAETRADLKKALALVGSLWLSGGAPSAQAMSQADLGTTAAHVDTELDQSTKERGNPLDSWAPDGGQKSHQRTSYQFKQSDQLSTRLDTPFEIKTMGTFGWQTERSIDLYRSGKPGLYYHTPSGVYREHSDIDSSSNPYPAYFDEPVPLENGFISLPMEMEISSPGLRDALKKHIWAIAEERELLQAIGINEASGIKVKPMRVAHAVSHMFNHRTGQVIASFSSGSMVGDGADLQQYWLLNSEQQELLVAALAMHGLSVVHAILPDPDGKPIKIKGRVFGTVNIEKEIESLLTSKDGSNNLLLTQEKRQQLLNRVASSIKTELEVTGDASYVPVVLGAIATNLESQIIVGHSTMPLDEYFDSLSPQELKLAERLTPQPIKVRTVLEGSDLETQLNEEASRTGKSGALGIELPSLGAFGGSASKTSSQAEVSERQKGFRWYFDREKMEVKPVEINIARIARGITEVSIDRAMNITIHQDAPDDYVSLTPNKANFTSTKLAEALGESLAGSLREAELEARVTELEIKLEEQEQTTAEQKKQLDGQLARIGELEEEVEKIEKERDAKAAQLTNVSNQLTWWVGKIEGYKPLIDGLDWAFQGGKFQTKSDWNAYRSTLQTSITNYLRGMGIDPNGANDFTTACMEIHQERHGDRPYHRDDQWRDPANRGGDR